MCTHSVLQPVKMVELTMEQVKLETIASVSQVKMVEQRHRWEWARAGWSSPSLLFNMETVWIFTKWPNYLVVLIFAPSVHNMPLFHRRCTLEDHSSAIDVSLHSHPLHGELNSQSCSQWVAWNVECLPTLGVFSEVHWQSEKQFLSLCVACFSASLLTFKEGFECKWWVLKCQLLL